MSRDEVLGILRESLRIDVESNTDYDGDFRVAIRLKLDGEVIAEDIFYISRPRY